MDNSNESAKIYYTDRHTKQSITSFQKYPFPYF